MPGNARKIATSKVSVKSQTVLPREVRDRLGLKPGDSVRYVIEGDRILIEKEEDFVDDPFIAFTEWAGPVDEAGYADL